MKESKAAAEKKAGQVSRHIGVRLTPAEDKKYRVLCKKHHLGPSILARKIILDFIDNGDFKKKSQ